MAFRVVERGREREIIAGILVCPGQPLPRHNHPGPGDPPVTHAQLVTVHTQLVMQLGRIYWSFSIEEGREPIRYSFRISVDLSEDPTPVRRGVPDGGREGRGWMEDTTDEAHTRSHLAALREAMRLGHSNIMVVLPFFSGSSFDACAPRVDPAAGLRMPQPSGVHAGLQTEASNAIWIGLNMLDPDDDQARGTAAHEVGHLFGLASRHRVDGGIMGRRSASARTLDPRDQALIHLAIEARIPGVALDSSVRPAPRSPRLHGHGRVHRGR